MIYIFWFRIQVNNAAIVIQKPTVEVTAEEFSTIMAINFESVYHLSQLAHPLLKASGAGSIVFISSVAGVVSVKYLSAYSVTKGISLHDPHYIYIYIYIASSWVVALVAFSACHYHYHIVIFQEQ